MKQLVTIVALSAILATATDLAIMSSMSGTAFAKPDPNPAQGFGSGCGVGGGSPDDVADCDSPGTPSTGGLGVGGRLGDDKGGGGGFGDLHCGDGAGGTNFEEEQEHNGGGGSCLP